MTLPSSHPPLVLVVTARTLFNQRERGHALSHCRAVAHASAHDEHGAGLMRPGSVFTLVRKLLALNTDGPRRVEVIVLSADSAAAGSPVLHAIDYHGLPITRAVFTRGAPCHRYAAAFGADLFLSTDAQDVHMALAQGMAAATVMDGAASEADDDIVRIAFDGDAVLFSDEAEQIYTQAGLDAFIRSEQAACQSPLQAGPLRPFLTQLHRLQTLYERDACPIRTALVTARSVSTHARALNTLRTWCVEVDEAIFLGGTAKGPLLRCFGADIFFDDQKPICDAAAPYVPCAHVPYGIKNRSHHPVLQQVA